MTTRQTFTAFLINDNECIFFLSFLCCAIILSLSTTNEIIILEHCLFALKFKL